MNDAALATISEETLSINDMRAQVNLIQHVMQKVMKKDEHYGTIPGTSKPTLYKAGAEKLSLTFRLAPSYEGEREAISFQGAHREYVIKCILTHIPTDKVFGQGLGSCTTMEAKYRYRTGEVSLTDKPVPQDYWTLRKENPSEALKLIGGKGHTTKKDPNTGKWMIAVAGEKVEHDNPADYYNTVLKMAKKRAYVDAMLSATAASDIFTQDIDDMKANENAGSEPSRSEVEHKAEVEAQDDIPVEESSPPANGERKITEKQVGLLHAKFKEKGFTEDQRYEWLSDNYGVGSTKDLPFKAVNEIMEIYNKGMLSPLDLQNDIPY
ncbi:MAG: hypothetical protein KAV87_12885 [Desulfobacteraceae bacterium]|nr:hypothetical protein [Desulfobacteraceae bacterium]